jgi:hypothetical protein
MVQGAMRYSMPGHFGEKGRHILLVVALPYAFHCTATLQGLLSLPYPVAEILSAEISASRYDGVSQS